jgi:hypothetical protein
MIIFMKKSLLVFLIFICSACAHESKKFEDNLVHQKCDDASRGLPGSAPLERSADEMKYLTKNAAAYSYVGANYAAEVVWDVSTGTVAYVGICGIPTAGIVSTGSVEFFYLIPAACAAAEWTRRQIQSGPLGRRALQATQAMRCPSNLTVINDSLQRVASCYENRGDQESLKKAATSLENIEKSKGFFSCLEPEDQMLVRSRREEIERRITSN